MYAAQQSQQFNNLSHAGAALGASIGLGQPSNTVPEVQREIPREWESVCQRMEYLEAMANMLIDRLSPLSFKRPNDAGKVEGAEAPIGTALGNDLHCLKRRIQAVADRLSLATQDLAI